MRDLCLPLGEGGSRVPRKRETDEGKEYFPVWKTFMRIRRGGHWPPGAAPLEGSEGKTDCHTSVATLVRNDNFYFGAMLRRICMHKTGRKSEFSISFSKKL